MVPPLLDLVCRLAVDEAGAAERADGVVAGRPVDAVPLPGLGPHDEYGDAGDEAAEGPCLVDVYTTFGGFEDPLPPSVHFGQIHPHNLP